MDTNRLKRFAQSARKLLMETVANKLKFVMAPNSPARREASKAVADLEKAIREKGEATVIDFVAYTWFNRFCALRYMDVMGYNPVRIVSPLPGHFQPEILEEAKANNFSDDIAPNTKTLIRDILSSERPDAQTEAYKLLLVSACNTYNKSMPFLFQPIRDYTEFLMPDDLMSGNSILALTREAILPEVAESGVEVIGWLYQFYISEKKDEVMGKTVKTEDIPAATQLFTPDWIVRYLVENSLGRLWMLNHPTSRLAESMEYYIASTEQDKDFLKVSSPEELKICDPCCGSGHMLTYAFDLLVKIYEEVGYSTREIPALILKNNLYAVEIDPRAGELAAFALTMKAREYDPRFLRRENASKPNICVLRNIHFEDGDFGNRQLFDESGIRFAALEQQDHKLLHDLFMFDKADCFGSLLIPELSESEIDAALKQFGEDALAEHADLFDLGGYGRILCALEQAKYLSPRYHVVVTNPPYMGGKGMNADLKKFAESKYPESKADLFAMFIERCLGLVQKHGSVGMITMQSWMFLSSFEKLRAKLLDEDTILTMAHLGPRGFDTIGGEVVQTTAFTLSNTHIPGYKGAFIRLVDGNNEAEKATMFKANIAQEQIDKESI
ncbi:MAG: BREX-1 system adenine-specific DNA-methyltransferase PglX [Alphaproteobacteria bacterium]|nr:BREX-1 system adenine-specific DNA-methyltransferase PglX [Alphaproteobacteria bacterium]